MKQCTLVILLLTIIFSSNANNYPSCWQAGFLVTCSAASSIWSWNEYCNGTGFKTLSPVLTISALCCCGSIMSSWNELPRNTQEALKKKLKIN